ncbi:hypothetical protein K443DRAFT_5271 [Laccaria amethystina LaAM-08-1]|uniref:Uncharacterized protein n=1 Tax=Laccaria amethystina LaAM-08-1 TaxID=1095629 RepID=A0A0C9XPX3_9AGAR|nr:hypothetical protein K443DRAFT_5271 [Laccaria amethystina LaAM-08-1]
MTPIASVAVLERALAGSWSWISTYGSDLSTEFQKLDIPPMQPKHRQTKVAKRAQETDDGAADNTYVSQQGNPRSNTQLTLTTSSTRAPH